MILSSKEFYASVIFFVLVTGLMLTGCASIMNGTTQNIGFSSSPTGATIIVDNMKYGKTPAVIRLTRKDNHIVKITLKGYQPYEVTLTRDISGWALGNILFGGIVGLAIDAISGGLYKLTPAQVHANLSKNQESILFRKNFLYVAVVLMPDPRWEKIGKLKKESL